MVRFFLALGFYVVVGRWLYSEAELSAPNLVPVIDATLEKVQIPTHDTWDWEKIGNFAKDVRSYLSSKAAAQ